MPTILVLLAFLSLILGSLLVRPLAEAMNSLMAQDPSVTIKKLISETMNILNAFYRWVHAHCPFAGQVFYMTFTIFLTFYGRDLDADEYSLTTTIGETLFWSISVTVWTIDTCVLMRRRLGRKAIACILGNQTANLAYALLHDRQFSLLTIVLLFRETMSTINLVVLLGQFYGLFCHWMGWPMDVLDADW